MHFPLISPAFKYNLTDIKAHDKACGNVIKEMGYIFPGLVINSEESASNQRKNQLQRPVNIKIFTSHFQLSHIHLAPGHIFRSCHMAILIDIETKIHPSFISFLPG